MCSSPNQSPPTARRSDKLLLTSVASFCGDEKQSRPSGKSLLVTGLFVLAFLCLMEQTVRHFLISIQHLHPLLEDETNRNILARHFGVDAFSCFGVAIMGWRARHIVQDLIDATWNGQKNAMPVAFEHRMYTYHPESARITLYFFAYQVKNLYDTIVWNDGPEFILHHILTLFTAWGALIPGTAHFYAPFYLGFSEASTAVLCVLANFDDEHGVKGFGQAFPMAKIGVGAIFAVTFLTCRVLMWSTISYYYCRDAWNALSNDSDPRLKGRRTWLRFTFFSLGLLSLLQVIWLGEIVRVGYVEVKKAGLL